MPLERPSRGLASPVGPSPWLGSHGLTTQREVRRPRPEGIRRRLAHHQGLRQEVGHHTAMGEERPAQPRRLPLSLRLTPSIHQSQRPLPATTRARRLARRRPAQPLQPHDRTALPLPPAPQAVRRTHRVPHRTRRCSLTRWHREVSAFMRVRPEDHPTRNSVRPAGFKIG